MIKAIYANTWDDLTVKMLGYNHDHCHHYYIGSIDDVPPDFKEFKKNNWKFIFIYEEDEPHI